MTWEQLRQAPLEAVLTWAEDEPWSRAMADCPQDARWHSEGDVWTHTKMVLRQLPELQEWPSLTPGEQCVLIFTALLHDVAKPLTTSLHPETPFRPPAPPSRIVTALSPSSLRRKKIVSAASGKAAITPIMAAQGHE